MLPFFAHDADLDLDGTLRVRGDLTKDKSGRNLHDSDRFGVAKRTNAVGADEVKTCHGQDSATLCGSKPGPERVHLGGCAELEVDFARCAKAAERIANLNAHVTCGQGWCLADQIGNAIPLSPARPLRNLSSIC